MVKAKKVMSAIKDFRHLEPHKRLSQLGEVCSLSEESQLALSGENSLPVGLANGMIENVIGKFELPLGVATNFKVNGKDYLVPMAVEEPSVVAAASYMAKIARDCGGFSASTTSSVMRAQIQILNLRDPFGAKVVLYQHREEIIKIANSRDRILVNLGGGCVGIDVHVFETTRYGPMVVLHLEVDVKDAMGANTVNTMAETVAPKIEEITGGKVSLRILSNLADLRLARASVRISPFALSSNDVDGKEIAKGICQACELAIVDPYRAATHNKGIMNGIDPVVIATGNDWRAIEAGAHAWAARSGRYTSLSRWETLIDGTLVGTMELPMALGLVGGATKTHPSAQAAIEMMDVSTASELAQVTAAVGLAQNMAALRALSNEGIQKGHMALHARNIAIIAGAKGSEIDVVAKKIVDFDDVTVDRAKKLLSSNN